MSPRYRARQHIELGGGTQRIRPQQRRLGVSFECSKAPAATFRRTPPEPPIVAQGKGKAQQSRVLVRRLEMSEGRTIVLQILVDRVEKMLLIGSSKARPKFFRSAEVVRGMSPYELIRLGEASEPLDRVLADRLQHPEALV